MTTSSTTARWEHWPALRPAAFLIATLAVIGLSAYGSQRLWRENGLRSLQAINEPRVELIANAVHAEVNRQDHLPVVLALDADVRAALRLPPDGARVSQVSQKLQRIIIEADTRALYVVGLNGTVLAGASANPSETLVGRNLTDRSYFVKAIESGRSSYLGVEPVSNRVRYYLTEAIRETSLLGVAVVRIEFDDLESTWERGGERVLVTDADGVVFLASDRAFKYRVIEGAKSKHLATESAPPNYPESMTRPVDMTVIERRGANAIVRVSNGAENVSYLYQTLPLPEYGWTIHRFADLGAVEADERDGAIIGAAVSALIISLLLYLVQRQRALLAARRAGAQRGGRAPPHRSAAACDTERAGSGRKAGGTRPDVGGHCA
jgi:two-component system C4-dicarboxylate transport sensor histidine kinase DctB